jgi:hypothetical protein
MSYKATGREAQWMDSTARAIAALCYGETGAVFNTGRPTPLESLLEQDVVLELDALTNTDKTFLIEALLLWIHHYRLQESRRETFKHAIMIEEAHHVLLRRQESRETVMDVIFREIRELGESLIIFDQHPSLISIPALGNANCTIGMELKHSRDVSAMAQALLLGEEEREYLGRLPVGQGIAKVQSRWPMPFLVSFPLVLVSKGSVTDAQIAALPGDSAANEAVPPPQTAKEVIQAIPAADKSVGEWLGLGEEALSMILDVARYPASSITDRYQRLSLSASRGSRLLLSLSSFLSSAPVSTPTGRVRFLRLTAKGREVARLRGVTLPPARGNESPEHEYWKHRAAEHYRQLGYQVEVEKELPNGHVVDVWAEKDGETVGVEIESEVGSAVENFEKCSRSQLDRLNVVCIQRFIAAEVSSLLSHAVRSGRVAVTLAGA